MWVRCTLRCCREKAWYLSREGRRAGQLSSEFQTVHHLHSGISRLSNKKGTFRWHYLFACFVLFHEQTRPRYLWSLRTLTWPDTSYAFSLSLRIEVWRGRFCKGTLNSSLSRFICSWRNFFPLSFFQVTIIIHSKLNFPSQHNNYQAQTKNFLSAYSITLWLK